MSNNKEFYYCYSQKLYRFATNLGFVYDLTDVHRLTGVRFWRFKRTPEFCQCLTLYSTHNHTDDPKIRHLMYRIHDTGDADTVASLKQYIHEKGELNGTERN